MSTFQNDDELIKSIFDDELSENELKSLHGNDCKYNNFTIFNNEHGNVKFPNVYWFHIWHFTPVVNQEHIFQIKVRETMDFYYKKFNGTNEEAIKELEGYKDLVISEIKIDNQTEVGFVGL